METTGLFWDFMTTQSVQVALVFGVVAGVNWMLRNRSAHIRYLLWLVVLVKCVTPPIVTFSLPVLPGETTLQMPSAVRSETMDYGLVEPAAVKTEAVEKTAVPVPEKTQVNLATVEPLAAAQTERPALSKSIMLWVVLWAAGAACYLLWALGRAILLGRRLKHSRRPLPAELMIEQIETQARLWDYPGGFKVWLMDGIGQPFVWGLWRGAIYLPTRFQSIQTDRQKAIVIHEMAHVVRLDAFVNLLQILIQGVFWFHPLVWLANRIIRQEREKCCDEIAVARLGTAPREYGSAIVDTLLQEVQTTFSIPTLAVARPVKNIEDRIKTIMQPGRRFLRRPSIAAMLIIGLLAAVVVPTTIALTHKVTPPDYVLSGTVMDAQSGQPIAGAIVLDDGYGPQPYQKGITDDAGKFEYKSWNEEHNITARADGYKSQTMVFTTAPLDNSKALDFKLSKAAPGEKVDLVPAEFDLQIDSQRDVCYPVVTIANEGKAALPKMKLRFYRGSPDLNRDEVGNEHHGWHEAGPIEPGKTWRERTDGFHLDDGVYEFAVVLDYDNAIAETDEANNAMSLQIKVVNGQVVEKKVTPSAHKEVLSEAGTLEPSQAILLERKDLLQKMLETEEQKFQSGISGPMEVFGAKLNLLAVEKELAGTSQERIVVLHQIAALRQEAENTTKLMFESGRATEAALNQAKLERLQAEEELARAEATGKQEEVKLSHLQIPARAAVRVSSALQTISDMMLKIETEWNDQNWVLLADYFDRINEACDDLEGKNGTEIPDVSAWGQLPSRLVDILEVLHKIEETAEGCRSLATAKQEELLEQHWKTLKGHYGTLCLSLQPKQQAAGEVQNSKDRALNEKFTATLPNGIAIELIGIREFSSKDKTWWGPDGMLLPMDIITHDNSAYQVKNKGFEVVYYISGPEEVAFDMPKVDGSTAQSGLEVVTPAGMKAIRTHLNVWGDSTTIRFPIATGSWKTLGTTSGSAQTSTPVGNRKLMFSSVIGSEKQLTITVTDDLQQFDNYRLVAVDKQGSIHVGSRNWFSVNNTRQNTFTFTNLDSSVVDRYEFQARPFSEIQFKNVSLKVGKKTDVKIEIPKEMK
ncbi:MAG TPA: M56 family metallopeptidase [Anaerohalosphaeraceae bacterium]|nr:M56 family metallopeptidase [Anaerohalosphaeraceae bacterium]